ncbi:hypothetical protein PsAD2_00203 [Pseudovibrio axinellae]|uniref:DUF423 domain-containing protein n=1 Tax=Pseudovibrio axinellae TaxID=989403 RepID=A0A166B0D4_9HYPH|nr:DUF423 domain-containing protein [Pseudovibrio axinellae]KZL21782.1 hypothetical protein PsAD2_00203 [Pseudovibrio axinellae]SEQ78385.1 Uncharacterized membrane protein YgdD, TMEM256/DUF423 family [Pseudovibrio axinellae]
MPDNAGDVAHSDVVRFKFGQGLGLGLALGGICGVVAILSSAAASHAIDNQYLMTISQITMMHAAAFVGLGVAHGITSSRGISFAMLLLFAGVGLFCGDLAQRLFVGEKLFDFAAPTGGMLMILGWLTVFLCGLSRMMRG